MPTETDSKEYTSNNSDKTVTIKGQAGKQIKIESVSLQLASGKDTIMNTTTLSINGTAYGEWRYKLAKYSEVLTYNKYPYTVDAGKDAVLVWNVESENKSYAAKMKTASYTYSYVDVSGNTPTENENSFIVVQCKKSDVTSLTATIKKLASDAVITTLNQK